MNATLRLALLAALAALVGAIFVYFFQRPPGEVAASLPRVEAEALRASSHSDPSVLSGEARPSATATSTSAPTGRESAPVAQTVQRPALPVVPVMSASPAAPAVAESRAAASEREARRTDRAPAGQRELGGSAARPSSIIVNPSGSRTLQMGGGGMAVEIPPGVRVPAAYLSNETPLPPIVEKAKQDIVRDFEKTIAAAVQPGAPPQDLDQAWEDAKRAADERLRALFGDDAFNAYTIRAATEALRARGSQRK